MQRHTSQTLTTLDLDATLPDFGDGNVGAGYDMLRIVKESIAALPERAHLPENVNDFGGSASA